MRGISSWLLQHSEAAASYLGRGVSPHRRPSWPWTWNSSSRPSCASSATAPWTWGCSSWPPPLASGVGVAPSGCCPWPRAWGSSSWLFLRHHSLALPASVPDFRHGVATLGCHPRAWRPPGFCPWPQTWGSSSWLRHVCPCSRPHYVRCCSPKCTFFIFPAHIYSLPQTLSKLASLPVWNCSSSFYSRINFSFWQSSACFVLP